MNPNPFAALGLPERPDLDDETVRAAWRAIAAATHPDRADGGDLARYTQASAAYAELRTPWSRSEAYADLVEQARREGRYDEHRELHPAGTDPGTEPLPIIPAATAPASRLPSGNCSGAASHRLTYSTTHGRSVCAATALMIRSHRTLSKNFSTSRSISQSFFQHRFRHAATASRADRPGRYP